MTLLMPAPEPEILSRRDEIVARLRAILPAQSVIADETARRAYDCRVHPRLITMKVRT